MISRSRSLDVGSVLQGRYSIEALLGQGGFGAVYRARQLATGQTVAIKVMQPVSTSREDIAAQTAARFARELELIGRLKHRHIVGLIDSGRLDHADDPASGDDERGKLFIALEFIDGEPLCDVIARRGRLGLRQTLRLMTQVAEALAFAHGKGVVHRDLKPENIMVTEPDGRANAVVLDFGIAGLVESARGLDYRSITAEGSLPGTPAYMAPEQLRGVPLSPAVDVYAWGLVFVECLRGTPIVDLDDGPVAHMVWQTSDEPVPIPEEIESHWLGAVLRRACAKDPAQRYPSATALVEALEAGDRIELDDAVETAGTVDLQLDHAQALASRAGAVATLDERADQTIDDDATATTRSLAPVGGTPSAAGLLPTMDSARPLPAVQPTDAPAASRDRSHTLRRVLTVLLVALALLVAVLVWLAVERATSSGDNGNDDGASSAAPRATGAAQSTLVLGGVEPPDATVLIDGVEIGSGAGRHRVASHGPAVLTVLAEGHDAHIEPVTLPVEGELELGPIALARQSVPAPAGMVYVPLGSFWRGCIDTTARQCPSDARPRRRIDLSAFYIDRTEVSVADWGRCVAAGGCEPAASQYPGSGEACNASQPEARAGHPINCVTWQQAADYCAWAGKRLPTEAEWEKAARGEDERAHPWGAQPADCTLAEMRGAAGRSGCGRGHTAHVYAHPEGMSPWGVLNMSGNVGEWVQDVYAPDAYEVSSTQDPQGPPSGPLRVSRGGGYDDDADELVSWVREGERGEDLDADQGFRCAKSANLE